MNCEFEDKVYGMDERLFFVVMRRRVFRIFL